MSLTKPGAERLKLLVKHARKLRERSAVLQAQSKELQKLVREQHYEMLLLLETSVNALPFADCKPPKANR